MKVDLIVGEKPRKGCEGSHDSLEGDDRLFHIAVKEEDRRSRETVKTYIFYLHHKNCILFDNSALTFFHVLHFMMARIVNVRDWLMCTSTCTFV